MIRVSAIQFRPVKGDVSASRAALGALAGAAAAGADLVVLPEMAATGYVFPDAAAVRAVAEPPRGPTLDALAPVARAHGAWIVCGFPERAGDRLFNSALVVDPAGELAFTYRKTLLYDEDLHWATPGDSGYRVLETDAGRFGVGICMDLNDDRFVAWCRTTALDVVAMPTNWVEEDIAVWPYWRMRMRGVPGALVAANTWGSEGRITFSGRSAVMRDGVVLAGAPARGNAVIRADLE